MQTLEKRTSKRLAVPHDRAQCLVVIGTREFRAVIADTSSTGVGLLMMRGINVAVGTQLKLVTEEGIAHCVVVHSRNEENFLHIGIRRLSEIPFDELPEFRQSTKFFKESMSTASPLIFLGVVLGFSSVMIGMILFVDVATSRHTQQAEVEKLRVRAIDASVEELSDYETELLEPKVTLRESAATEVNEFLDNAEESLDKLKSRHSRMIATVLEGTGTEWEEVAKKLRITPEQEAQIRAALDKDPFDQTAVITRARVMSFLNQEQRATFARILATVSDSAG